MKKALFTLTAAFFAQLSLLQAQVAVKGQILQTDHSTGIPSANISLSNGQSAVADEQGRFYFPKLSAGTYRVKISSIGFKSLDTSLSADQANWVILLQKQNILMAPIEIRAVRAGEKAPFTQTTIQAKEIAKNNLGQDLPFLLNQTPSVVVNADAGNGIGYTGIRIRGTDATRINITLNGIPYNDAESQGVFFVNLPDFSSSVNSIQVQRGVGTSSNGTGAFGATINMATNDTRELAYVELNNSFGSFNSWKNTLSLGSGLLDDHFTFDARLSRISSDGYIDRATSDLKSFFFSGAYLNERSSLRFNVFSGKEKTYQAWYGVPEELLETNRRFNPAGTEKPGTPYDNETDNYQQTHYQLFFNHQFTDKLSFQTALFYTRGKGYYEQYKAGEDYNAYGIDYPINGQDTTFETDLVRQLWLDNHFFGQTFSLQYKDEKKEIIAGGGGSRYIGNHYGEVIWTKEGGIEKNHRWYDLDADKNDLNMYVKWQQNMGPKLSFFADLQYRHVDYTINGFRNNPTLRINEQWNFLNPKLGLSYKIKNGQAYLSWAVANKEPNRDDFEAGATQQPKPENLNNVELGIEKKTTKMGWGATAYYMRYRDQLVLTGQINDVGAYTRTNIPESYRLGIELQGYLKPANWFAAQANMTLSENKVIGFTSFYDDYDNGGQKSETFEKTDISFSPAVTAAATLIFTPLKNLEIALPGKYVSRQYLDNTSRKNRSLDPYYTQDLRINYLLPLKWIREMAFILQVNNLFNTKYEPNGYTYSYQYGGQLIDANNYYPMAGTNFMLGLNLKW
jgi:iron complex outermembrane receptor protein